MHPIFLLARGCAIALLASCLITSSAEANDVGVGDAPEGALLFSTRCAMCHTFDSNKLGPSMHGVYGRKAATVEGYDYSAALKASNITWDEISLDKWLADPAGMVPGTKMTLYVPSSAKDRADIIAYLKNVALPSNEKK